jgi:hypothetical protein
MSVLTKPAEVEGHPRRGSAELRARRPRLRACLRGSAALLVLITAVVVFAAGAGASEKSSASGQVYFYGDLANAINSSYSKNPLLVRPSLIGMFEDGSWVLEKLRWSSWGSSVASARGISSASNCTPNCATGKRTNVPAQLTLSSPGLVLGHRVYRCFQLTVPSHPAEHECLGHIGKLIAYSPISKPTPPATSAVAFSPDPAGISCILKDNGTVQGASVFCWLGSQWPPATHAQMGLDGQLDETTIIPQPVGLGGPDLQYGKSVTIGRFRCTSAVAGLSCVVTKTGKGFLIGPAGITSLG